MPPLCAPSPRWMRGKLEPARDLQCETSFTDERDGQLGHLWGASKSRVVVRGVICVRPTHAVHFTPYMQSHLSQQLLLCASHSASYNAPQPHKLNTSSIQCTLAPLLCVRVLHRLLVISFS